MQVPCCRPHVKELRKRLHARTPTDPHFQPWHTLESTGSGVDVFPFNRHRIKSFDGVVAIRRLRVPAGWDRTKLCDQLMEFMNRVKGCERRQSAQLRDQIAAGVRTRPTPSVCSVPPVFSVPMKRTVTWCQHHPLQSADCWVAYCRRVSFVVNWWLRVTNTSRFSMLTSSER